MGSVLGTGARQNSLDMDPGNSGDLIQCSGGFKRSSCSMPLTRLLGMWEPGGHFRDELLSFAPDHGSP